MTARYWAPMAAASVAGIQVGVALVASRYVIDQTTPITLAMLRYGIGFCCLAPLLLFTPRPWISWHDVGPVSILGFIQFGVVVALLNYALYYLSPSRIALIFTTIPIQTILLTSLMGRETMTVAKSVGASLTILGIAIVLGEDLLVPGNIEGQWIGAAIVLASAFCASISNILIGPYLQKYPSQNIGAIAMLATTGFLFVFAGLEGGLATIVTMPPNAWWLILLIGVGSGGGYFAWLWALKHLSPTRVTMFISLGPITSAVLGVIFLSEDVSPYLIVGTAVVLTGVALALKERQQ